MKTLKCVKHFEHIHIMYEGGDVTMKYREYYQTLNLLKQLRHMVMLGLLFQVLHGLNTNILLREVKASISVCCEWAIYFSS